MGLKLLNKIKNGKLSTFGSCVISVISVMVLTAMIVGGYVLINILSVTNGDPVINLEDEEGNDIIVYHARKEAEIVGDPLYNPNRHAMLMKVKWDEAGRPVFSYED